MGVRSGLLVLHAVFHPGRPGHPPGSPYNETHFNDSKYIKLYDEAVATLDVSKRTEIAHEMQMIDYNEGGTSSRSSPP